MQISKGSTSLRRLKFGMYNVLVALQNCTLPFFEILNFWPSRGVQSSNVGQIWQKMAKIELWTPHKAQKIKIS